MFDELLSEGILTDVSANGSVRLTERFEETVANERERITELNETKREELVRETVRTDDSEDVLYEIGKQDADFIARYAVVEAYMDDVSEERPIRSVYALDQFFHESTPTSGVPDGFLPISGNLLRYVPDLFTKSIAYIWREDCDPCDVVRADLEQILDEPAQDIALFAVYGPEYSVLLSEEFDVVGGPTTLFIAGGSVDARIQGASHRMAIENEVEILRDLD